MATCPVCDGDVELESNTVAGELITCADCGSELEVKTIDPPSLEEAPDAEEDWGQ